MGWVLEVPRFYIILCDALYHDIKQGGKATYYINVDPFLDWTEATTVLAKYHKPWWGEESFYASHMDAYNAQVLLPFPPTQPILNRYIYRLHVPRETLPPLYLLC